MGNTILTSQISATSVLENNRVTVQFGGAARPTKKPLYTAGDITMKSSDIGRKFISTDATPVNYFLPPNLPAGDIDVFQGGSGQITFVPINGATVVDGALRSAGKYTEKKWNKIHSFGDDTFMVAGDVVEGLLDWSIIGSSRVREGDAATYIIWRPDTTEAYDDGVTLTVTGTGFDTAGFDQTLVQALAFLAALDPGVDFDGVDQLTIRPEARNPLPLHFFAKPTYQNLGDRSVTITISNPSVGEIASETVTTSIINTSKPVNPASICDADPLVVDAIAASGQANITVVDASDVEVYSAIQHASIPAQTYVLAVNENVITLSANLTGSISVGASLVRKRPGFFFDFSDVTKITKDGSDVVSQVADSINGYTISQATAGSRPSYVASMLNGKGGLSFAGSRYLTGTSEALAKILNTAGSKYTCIIVGKVAPSFTNSGNWISGPLYLSANATSGIMTEGGTGASTSNDVRTIDNLDIPFVMMDMSDGYSNVVKINGQRAFIPVTLTADAEAGQKDIIVDDVSNLKTNFMAHCPNTSGFESTNPNDVGLQTGNEDRISAINTGTKTITMNANLGQKILAGTTVYFFSHIVTHAPINPAKSATILAIGADTDGSFSLKCSILGVLLVPRCLSPQQWRGIHKYYEGQYSTSVTTTADGAVSAGARKIPLASVTGIHRYQIISGTNIKPGTTIVKINTSTKEIWVDEDILAGGIANGATITFSDCAFKKPDTIDINDFVPTFRDDFSAEVALANSGTGWKDYYGELNAPGTFPSAYGAAGHGSSNNGSAERQWYLDKHNWSPWQAYNPFSQHRDDDMPTGGLKITASPAAPEIANLIGYVPPQPTLYTHTSGYIRDAGGFSQQYGYWEGRLKIEQVLGVWTGFWLTAAGGSWPPEIDIWELYGDSPGKIWQNVFRNQAFSNSPLAARTVSTLGDIWCDNSQEYVLFGCEVDAENITLYMNREKVYSCQMSWSTHVPWLIQLNMAVANAQSPDNVSTMSLFCDYLAAWRRIDPVVTLTGATQAETTALVSAMSVAPSGARQTLINAFIEEMKLTPTDLGANLWSDNDLIIMPAAHDAQAGRIDWKNPARIGTVVGSPTFTVDRGYAGTLNSSYIDMGYVLSAESGFQLNNSRNQYHIGAVANNITRSDSIAIGTSNFRLTPRSGNSVTTQLWSTAVKTVVTSATNGHYIAVRNHFRYDFTYNGAIPEKIGEAGSDTKITDTDNLKICNGTSRVAMVHAGKYLTPDDRRRMYAIVYKYLHAIGAL